MRLLNDISWVRISGGMQSLKDAEEGGEYHVRPEVPVRCLSFFPFFVFVFVVSYNRSFFFSESPGLSRRPI